MAACEVCGNDYYMSFEIHAQGAVHTFDSLECAAHRMAPICEHCRCRVLGHGVESDGKFFCSAHCSTAAGFKGIVDHMDSKPHPGHKQTAGV